MIYTIFFRLAQLFFLAAFIASMAAAMGFSVAAQLESALWHILGLAVCGAVCTTSLSLLKENLKKIQYVRDTPTSSIHSAKQAKKAYVELKGRLEAIEQQPLLLSPLSQTPCLWFDYTIERHSTDKNSNSHTSGYDRWTTIDSAHSNEWFCLVDDSGQCHINPQGADITATHQTKIWHGNQPHPQHTDQHNRLQKMFSSNKYRYTERFLLPNQNLYALGYLQHKNNGQAILEKPSDGRPFVLSNQEENKIISSSRFNAWAGGVVFFIGMIAANVIAWHWQR